VRRPESLLSGAVGEEEMIWLAVHFARLANNPEQEKIYCP
jgi:hypothetical protein